MVIWISGLNLSPIGNQATGTGAKANLGDYGTVWIGLMDGEDLAKSRDEWEKK